MIKLHDIEQNGKVFALVFSFFCCRRIAQLQCRRTSETPRDGAGRAVSILVSRRGRFCKVRLSFRPKFILTYREHDVRANDARIIIRAPHGRYVKTMAVCQGRTEMVSTQRSNFIQVKRYHKT